MGDARARGSESEMFATKFYAKDLSNEPMTVHEYLAEQILHDA